MKTVRHVRLFVASPMELHIQVESVRTVISEINLTAGPLLGLWVEVLSWETHAFPAVGSDVQSTINAQIGDEYDIFLGLLWARIGTATPRAESGTIEEFNRALDRLKRHGDRPHIMFYFFDFPLSPSRIDGDQLHGVQSFQKRLRDSGVLYWTIGSTEEFVHLLRVHLTKILEKQAGEKVLIADNASADKEKLRLEHDYADICDMELRTQKCWEQFSERTKDFSETTRFLDKGDDLRYKVEFCKALPPAVDELLRAVVQVEATESELFRTVIGLLDEEYGVAVDTTKKEILTKIKLLMQKPTDEMAELLARLDPILRGAEDIATYMTALASHIEKDAFSIIQAKNSMLAMSEKTQQMLRRALSNRQLLRDRCDAALRIGRLARIATAT